MGTDGAARWQARFNARYGSASWPRAVEQARVVYRWHTIKRNDEPAGPRPHSFWQRAFQEQTLFAVILWRTARTQARGIDEVTMTDAAATCRSAIHAGGLTHGPMPNMREGEGVLPPEETAVTVLEAVLERLLEHADPPHTHPSLRRDRLGYIALGMLADPEPIDHLGGGWATARSIGEKHMGIVRREYSVGLWPVTPTIRLAVEATGLATTEPPAYDYPATPTPADRSRPSWLQRAAWLASLAPRLRAAADMLPPTDRGTLPALNVLLTSYAGLCDLLAPAVEVLDPRWAAEITRTSADWEAVNVPPALEQQTVATEDAIHSLRVFLCQIAD